MKKRKYISKEMKNKIEKKISMQVMEIKLSVKNMYFRLILLGLKDIGQQIWPGRLFQKIISNGVHH